MKDNFNLKKFLVENKLTTNSRLTEKLKITPDFDEFMDSIFGTSYDEDEVIEYPEDEQVDILDLSDIDTPFRVNQMVGMIKPEKREQAAKDFETIVNTFANVVKVIENGLNGTKTTNDTEKIKKALLKKSLKSDFEPSIEQLDSTIEWLNLYPYFDKSTKVVKFVDDTLGPFYGHRELKRLVNIIRQSEKGKQIESSFIQTYKDAIAAEESTNPTEERDVVTILRAKTFQPNDSTEDFDDWKWSKSDEVNKVLTDHAKEFEEAYYDVFSPDDEEKSISLVLKSAKGYFKNPKEIEKAFKKYVDPKATFEQEKTKRRVKSN